MQIRDFSAALALALTMALLAFGGDPLSASLFGRWHDLVHLTTYALLAVLYALALPRLRWAGIALLTIGVGALQEFYQFATGHHAYEFYDLALNAIGALAGCALFALLLRMRTRVV
jgi:VanZ family protein